MSFRTKKGKKKKIVATHIFKYAPREGQANAKFVSETITHTSAKGTVRTLTLNANGTKIKKTERMTKGRKWIKYGKVL